MKVLIVRLSAIGDVIQGIPCLVALKKTFPHWEISWLVEESAAAILQDHPFIKQLYIVPTNWRKEKGSLRRKWQGLRSILRMVHQVRAAKFDIVIDLQGLLKSGVWSFLSGAPRRIGFKNTREFAERFLNEHISARPVFDPSYPLYERYLEPAKYLGADLNLAGYVLPHANNEVIDIVNKLFTGSHGKPKIALCPWSNWETKNWPIDRWIELGRKFNPSHQIILVGGPGDRLIARNIEAQIPGILNLTGRTNLPVLAEVFRRCEIVIGPDSGPVHLANATAVPKILMLFGSTSWRRSGPIGTQHKTLSMDLKCQPCFERKCPLGHMNCQNSLELERVYEAAQILAH